MRVGTTAGKGNPAGLLPLAITKSALRPLLAESWNLNIKRHAAAQPCPAPPADTDCAVSGSPLCWHPCPSLQDPPHTRNTQHYPMAVISLSCSLALLTPRTPRQPPSLFVFAPQQSTLLLLVFLPSDSRCLTLSCCFLKSFASFSACSRTVQHQLPARPPCEVGRGGQGARATA